MIDGEAVGQGPAAEYRPQRETINQLVSQLSTGSDRSSGPSSCSTDPSVSFNFVCPVPRRAQRDSDSQPPTPSVVPHAGGSSQPNPVESSSQQVSLWANKHDSGAARTARDSFQDKPSRRGDRRQVHRSHTQQRRSSATGAAWRAATSAPSRDSISPEGRAPVVAPYRWSKPAPRACLGGQVSVHTAGSRIDLPTPVNNRLHSNTRLSPATSCSFNSPQLRPSRVPKARALHSRDARRALQSLTMPARRHTPAAHRSACKQRSAQPRPTIQTDHRGSARPAGGTRPPTAAPPSAAEDDGSGTDSVQQMQELSRLLHQVIMLHMVDGGPLAEAGKQLAAGTSQLDAREVSSLLHDAQQLITQVHQSPSVSTSMTAETLSFSPSLTHSTVTERSDATYPSPAWPQVQSAVCSPAQSNPCLADGTPSMDGMSTPCFSGSNVGAVRTAGVSAVASSPVPPSASSLSSDFSGTLTADDSVGLFIPALVLPMRDDAEQARLRRESNILRSGAHHTSATPQPHTEAAAAANPSDTGPLAAQGGASAALSSVGGSTREQQSACRPASPLMAAAADSDLAAAPVTPELPMPHACSVSSNLKHSQAALREKDAASSSDVQSSLVPAEWQSPQGVSGSCSGATDSGHSAACVPDHNSGNPVGPSARQGTSLVSGDALLGTSGSRTLPPQRTADVSRPGFDVSGGLPEGFSGALPEGFFGVLPPLAPGDDPSAPVYVVPITTSPRAPRGEFWQRTATAWHSVRSKMGLRKQERRNELSVTAAAPNLARELAAERLNRPQQHRPPHPPESAAEDSAAGVRCGCF